MKKIDDNIKELDNQIGRLIKRYEESEDDVERTVIMEEIDDLTGIRQKLKSSKVEGSNNNILISGALSIATVVLIMKYEEANVIATKAFGIATRMFKS